MSDVPPSIHPGEFEDLARLARKVSDTPVAFIGWGLGTQLTWVSRPEVGPEEVDWVEAMCRRALDDPARRELSDLAGERDPVVPMPAGDDPALKFFLLMASPVLVTGEIWFLGVADRRVQHLTPEQRQGLQTIHQQVLLRREQWQHSSNLARTAAEVQRLEAARREQEAFYQALVESLPQNIFRKDLEGRFTFANGRYCATLGQPLEAILGRTDSEFAPWELAAKYRLDDQKVLQSLEPLELIEKNIAPDGTVHWVQVIKTPILGAGGKPVGIQGIFWDITQEHNTAEKLQQAEANYRGIVVNARDGIFQTTPDGKYLSANPALARIYGFKSPEELMAKRTDIEHQLYLDPARRNEFARLMAVSGVVDQFESEVYRADGSVIWISENARAVRDSAGRLVCYEGTAEDITARKRAEEALSRANQELKKARDGAVESAAIKARFLANTSHELRTPMNAIIGFTQLLLDTPLNDEQREYTATVRASARSLLTLLNDILDFSKVESGKMVFERLEFSPRRLIEETADLMAELAFPKGLELTARLDHALPDLVTGDPGRIRQILTNLLGNAIKFTARGEVSLRAELESKTEGECRLRFVVSDTGIGIPMEAQPRIFEAFTQADESTTRKYGGSGLGLSISRQIVEQLGGRIGFTSEPGRGSVFWVTLPMEVPVHAVPKTETPRFSGCRVLIVDDQPGAREMLRYELEPLGADCIEAVGGAVTHEIIDRQTKIGAAISIVLLDLQLPDLDGITLAQELRQDPANSGMGIVIIAPMGQPVDREFLRRAGVAGCLIKPVKQSRLWDCVQKVLRGEDALDGGATGWLCKSVAPAASSLSPLKILLAEDNLVNQKVALAQLRRLGYSADVVANGREVLQALDQTRYQIVLMDCQMPELDGYETTRYIRRAERDGHYGNLWTHHVIAVTANAMRGDREKCLAAGMDAFLTKPLEIETLRSALEQAGERFGIVSVTESGVAPGVPVPELLEPKPSPSAGTVDSSVLDPSFLRQMRKLSPPGGPDEAVELIDLFLSEFPMRVEAVVRSVKERDLEAVRLAAHTLKGSAGNLGGHEVAKSASALEQAIKTGDWVRSDALIAALEKAAERLSQALSAERTQRG
ncbi:MAG: PAS domain-containing sensor histidine kinase [Pedosphaera sp.]|nr:PAS domain-containing sensor histidine kinase [Pedosphaera sp.]